MDIKNIDWELMSKKGSSFCVLEMDLVMEGMRRARQRKLAAACIPEYYAQFDDGRWFDKASVVKFKTDFADRLIADPAMFKDAMTEYGAALHEFRALGDSLKGNETFAKFIEALIERHTVVSGYLYYYVILDDILNERVKSILAGLGANFMEYSDVVYRPTIVPERVLERDSLRSLKRGETDMATHLEKYRHLGQSWFFGADYTEADITARIADMKDEADAGAAVYTNNKARTEKLLQSGGLAQDEGRFIEAFQQLQFNINEFDDSFAYFLSKSRTQWESFAKAAGITYEQLRWLRISEIQAAIAAGSLDETLRREIALREKGHIIVLHNDTIEIESAAAHTEARAADDVRELHGTVAHKGHATGPVKVVTNVEHISKVNKGDILVSVMTQPAYTPAMEKAAAILTDMGGLLSHAAIIARELRVPCIIDLKIATQVLRDGQMVEVDADKGIVRKI